MCLFPGFGCNLDVFWEGDRQQSTFGIPWMTWCALARCRCQDHHAGSGMGTTGKQFGTPAPCPRTACPALGLGISEAESPLVQKTIPAKPPKHGLMSGTAKDSILCCTNVIWQLLLLNNCYLLIYWIYFTKAEFAFRLETKLRTKSAPVKPNCFKPSLHSAQESASVREIKWPLNPCVQ